MDARLKECPKCGGEGLRTCWTKGRMLRQECADCDSCGWAGKPFVPEKKAIRTVRTIPSDFGAWHFEGFDKYGHTFLYSQAYASEAKAAAAAREELARHGEDSPMFPCVAIVWPPTTTVRGKLIRPPMPKKTKGPVSKGRIYECWGSDDGTELTFLRDNHPQHDFLTKDNDGKRMTHLYSVRARTTTEAMIEHHKAQGWAPYKPMSLREPTK